MVCWFEQVKEKLQGKEREGKGKILLKKTKGKGLGGREKRKKAQWNDDV